MSDRSYSNCCGALPVWDEWDLCSECGEHAEFMTEEEYEKECER